MAAKHFPCKQCGAQVEYDPGAAALKCPFCGAENPVPQATAAIEELDYRAHLERGAAEGLQHEHLTVKCQACAAEWAFAPDIVSGQCPFCGANAVGEGLSKRVIKPRSLLPFKVARDQAREAYDRWVKGLWFAPNRLRRFARIENCIAGMYVPYWTYDCDATSRYTGERGDDYWTTETYTTTVNGRSVTRTRPVKKTRWSSVSGTVENRFDDVLIVASESLPRPYTERLEPWDLQDLVPYRDDYLSGFRAESYTLPLPEGFVRAQEAMQPEIRSTIERQIGGDHQRIHSVNTRYDDVTFKHLLLPIWICAYRYGATSYRVLINARTGEVQGERPYSWIKIALFIILVLALVAAVAVVATR